MKKILITSTILFSCLSLNAMTKKEIGQSDEEKNNNLLEAVKKNNLAEVKRLTEAGADPNFAFVDAVENCNIKIIGYLLEKKADPNGRKKIPRSDKPGKFYYSYYPLEIAFRKCTGENKKNIVRKLLEKGAKEYDTYWDPQIAVLMDQALQEKDQNFLKLLVSILSPGSRKLHKKLTEAVEEEDFDKIKMLITVGANPNFENTFIQAMKKCDLEIIKFLLENKADPNQKEREFVSAPEWTTVSETPVWLGYPLDYAFQCKKAEIIKELVKHGARKQVGLYLQQKISLIKNALEKNDQEFLDNFKIDPSDGLKGAIEEKDKEMVRYFLEKGANPNVGLIVTAKKGLDGIINILLEKGADVNYQDPDPGRGLSTALMAAAANNKKETVKLLLDKGAKKAIRNVKGKTAYDYAKEKGYKDIAELVKPTLKEKAEVVIKKQLLGK